MDAFYPMMTVVVSLLVGGLAFCFAVGSTMREPDRFLGRFLRWTSFFAVLAIGAYLMDSGVAVLPRISGSVWGKAVIAYAALACWLLGEVVSLAWLLWRARRNAA